MTSPLDRAIDALSAPGTDRDETLRTLDVVSERVDAQELVAWIRSDLDGYPAVVTTPDHRTLGALPITVSWSGYFGSSARTSIVDAGLPDFLRVGDTHLRQPSAELHERAQGEQDSSAQLTNAWISLLRTALSEGTAPAYPTGEEAQR